MYDYGEFFDFVPKEYDPIETSRIKINFDRGLKQVREAREKEEMERKAMRARDAENELRIQEAEKARRNK